MPEVIAETRVPGATVTGSADPLGFARLAAESSARFAVSAGAAGAHAGENETSMMLALEPALTANGVLGDPAGATAERGEADLELFTERLVGCLAGSDQPCGSGCEETSGQVSS